MSTGKKVLIGIQARTGSTRLPNKAMKKILGVTTIEHVINVALKASRYMNRFSSRTGVECDVWVLVPHQDPLEEYLNSKNKGYYSVHAGHPTDLIDRYNDVVEKTNPDYIVRITGDCPLLPPFLITKSVNCAVKNNYHFFDNAHPEYRTFFDGADVEVMSRKAFDWLNEESGEREHVCDWIRNNTPEWMEGAMGFCFDHKDLSFLKLSIDTEKELELVKNMYTSVKKKKQKWEELYGRGTAHAF